MSEVTFTIKAKMEERWVSHFITLLKHMEYLGSTGSSQTLAFHADGDGDFRPKFAIDISCKHEKPYKVDSKVNVQALYDAGGVEKVDLGVQGND